MPTADTIYEVTMLRLLQYLLFHGTSTDKSLCPQLEAGSRILPRLTDVPCAQGCRLCSEICPTGAISVGKGISSVSLDRGKCISCSLCIDVCPPGTIIGELSTTTASLTRNGLIVGSHQDETDELGAALLSPAAAKGSKNPFKRSIAARIVSTGCSACDLEISAAGNPIFDMERFGIHVVASPRFADVLLVTGPVPKAMHDPLKRCYEAMAEPRKVIAVGTCAISGGVLSHGYTEANGIGDLVPVDAFVPGCPPHPWSIIHGILLSMGRLPELSQLKAVEPQMRLGKKTS
ncbi:MAG TPA: NADH-quinone oxidoreductase subunit NuoB [Candidatus Obscuribacterales bacterium]